MGQIFVAFSKYLSFNHPIFTLYSAAVDDKVWNRKSNTYIDPTSLVDNLPIIVCIKICYL